MKQAALIDSPCEDRAPLVESGGASPATFESMPQSIQGTPVPDVRLKLLQRLRPQDVLLLALASDGLNDKAIAREIGSSSSSVHQRWRLIREALKARDRAHAVAIALALNLIPPPRRALQMLKEGWAAET